MSETYISTVHSESGRRTGVVIISDDAKFIRDSKLLTDAIRAVWREELRGGESSAGISK